MDSDIRQYVEACGACKKAKARLTPTSYIPTLSLPLPSAPFSIVGMDFLSMPMTERGNKYLLVFTDYLTRWVEAVPVQKNEVNEKRPDEPVTLSEIINIRAYQIKSINNQVNEIIDSLEL